MACTYALPLLLAAPLAVAQVADRTADQAADQVELIVHPGEPDPAAALDVGLVVFHPGYKEDDGGDPTREGIFATIRDAEANYLPYALRRTLVDSNHWGAVRVLPKAATGVELLVTGRIVESDGVRLGLQVTARDGRGEVWLDQTFSGRAPDGAYAAEARRVRRPFQDIYNEIANALLAARERLDARALASIREVALLRYAGGLAPDAFGGHLEQKSNGEYRVRRLPARDDPMLGRIRRIRAQEHLLIDTTDEQYAQLYSEMMPVYDLWRSFQQEQALYRQEYQQRLDARAKPLKGSYEALKRTYSTFRWAKLQQQEMKLLAEGFNNEVAPASVDIEGRIFELSGSLDDRYQTWRGILKQIYDLETGR